jgi:membrane protease YdiL (CAAX protease family)
MSPRIFALWLAALCFALVHGLEPIRRQPQQPKGAGKKLLTYNLTTP